jgi:hypothetical protein
MSEEVDEHGRRKVVGLRGSVSFVQYGEPIDTEDEVLDAM